MFEKKYRGYNLGSRINLDNDTLDSIITLFSPGRDEKIPSVLEGRRAVRRAEIHRLGRVVVKYYARGGVVRLFNKQHYLNMGRIRSKTEFEFLLKAERCGAAVPHPVMYAGRGSLFYRAWLVTEEIPVKKNFMQLCIEDADAAASFLPAICKNIQQLINSGIYHVDLHPGNILIDLEDQNHIVDFDRARYFAGSRDTLSRLYMKRWKKAADKYGLVAPLWHLNLK